VDQTVDARRNQKDTNHGGSENRGGPKPAFPERNGVCGYGDWRDRLLGKIDNLTAAWTIREMGQTFEALVLGQHTFDEGVERVRVGMQSGM
jgi:hypothetical protein